MLLVLSPSTVPWLLDNTCMSTRLQGKCTTLGGLCMLDAKQGGRLFYGSGSWMKLTLRNVRLVNGNAGEASGGAVSLHWGCCCLLLINCVLLVRAPTLHTTPSFMLDYILDSPAPSLSLTPCTDLPSCPPQIFLDNKASAELTNCALEKNWGQSGGAIDMTNGNGLTLTGVSFDTNRAGSMGGAIAVQVCAAAAARVGCVGAAGKGMCAWASMCAAATVGQAWSDASCASRRGTAHAAP